MNKQERHKLYVSALENYVDNVNTSSEITNIYKRETLSGLCYSLNYCDANYDGKLLDAYHDLRKPLEECVLKEIVKHRPPNQYSNAYWFTVENTEIRIAILKMAIEETESDDESMCAK